MGSCRFPESADGRGHVALEQELVVEHPNPGHDLNVCDIGLTVDVFISSVVLELPDDVPVEVVAGR